VGLSLLCFWDSESPQGWWWWSSSSSPSFIAAVILEMHDARYSQNAILLPFTCRVNKWMDHGKVRRLVMSICNFFCKYVLFLDWIDSNIIVFLPLSSKELTIPANWNVKDHTKT
jgi:hypothetical protein